MSIISTSEKNSRVLEHRPSNLISALFKATVYCIQDSTSNESVRSYIRRNFNQLSCDTYSIFELPHRLISFAMDIIRGVKFLNCNKVNTIFDLVNVKKSIMQEFLSVGASFCMTVSSQTERQDKVQRNTKGVYTLYLYG